VSVWGCVSTAVAVYVAVCFSNNTEIFRITTGGDTPLSLLGKHIFYNTIFFTSFFSSFPWATVPRIRSHLRSGVPH